MVMFSERVNRADRVGGKCLGEKVVWQMLQQYAEAIGVPGIAPHDLRRTCAKLCRTAGGELEQIQLLLGHASIQTTERYPAARGQRVGLANVSNARSGKTKRRSKSTKPRSIT
jgi:integrase